MCECGVKKVEMLDAGVPEVVKLNITPYYNSTTDANSNFTTCHVCDGKGWVETKMHGAEKCPICGGEGVKGKWVVI